MIRNGNWAFIDGVFAINLGLNFSTDIRLGTCALARSGFALLGVWIGDVVVASHWQAPVLFKNTQPRWCGFCSRATLFRAARPLTWPTKRLESRVTKDQDFKNIKIEREGGVTFVVLNRPEKRNAMSPELHREMCEALEDLETEDETKVVVITGAGESFSAGQDIKLYFRSTEDNPKARARRASLAHWRWEKLSKYAKPTIAMVNGFCFGARSRLCVPAISPSPPMKRPSDCRK
jgi:hypothetical protein